jgi:hypothetical protein
VVAPLNNFEEESWPILAWFGENLQQISLLIEIDQNFEFLQKAKCSIWKTTPVLACKRVKSSCKCIPACASLSRKFA